LMLCRACKVAGRQSRYDGTGSRGTAPDTRDMKSELPKVLGHGCKLSSWDRHGVNMQFILLRRPYGDICTPGVRETVGSPQSAGIFPSAISRRAPGRRHCGYAVDW
jgi:hypothetical protein